MLFSSLFKLSYSKTKQNLEFWSNCKQIILPLNKWKRTLALFFYSLLLILFFLLFLKPQLTESANLNRRVKILQIWNTLQVIWLKTDVFAQGCSPKYLPKNFPSQRKVKCKMGLFQKILTTETFNYFCIKLHLRCLTGVWIRLSKFSQNLRDNSFFLQISRTFLEHLFCGSTSVDQLWKWLFLCI